MVTGWLLRKLNLDKCVPFNVNDTRSLAFMKFIRESKDIYPLFEEDLYLSKAEGSIKKFELLDIVWGWTHVVGALLFMFLANSAIVMNDPAEVIFAWISGVLFEAFVSVGYCTGAYLPVISPLEGLVLPWNPFMREPHFMLKLQEVCL